MSYRGRGVWYDLMTDDVEAAKAFYTEVVGWKVQEWGEGPGYSMWVAGETPVGGVTEQAGVPPHWMAHLAVEDVDAAAARAEELGGRVLTPGTDIPEVGRFAIVADPQGASFSLFTPGAGSEAPARPETGFFEWHELHTTDHASAWEFYSALFGWKHSSTMDMGEMGSYLIFRHPDDAEDVPTGAMFDAAKWDEKPPHWLYYVRVDDLDAAVARTRDRGGQVLHGPMEIPGGGRMAQCLDPQGGRFALVSQE